MQKNAFEWRKIAIVMKKCHQLQKNCKCIRFLHSDYRFSWKQIADFVALRNWLNKWPLNLKSKLSSCDFAILLYILLLYQTSELIRCKNLCSMWKMALMQNTRTKTALKKKKNWRQFRSRRCRKGKLKSCKKVGKNVAKLQNLAWRKRRTLQRTVLKILEYVTKSLERDDEICSVSVIIWHAFLQSFHRTVLEIINVLQNAQIIYGKIVPWVP